MKILKKSAWMLLALIGIISLSSQDILAQKKKKKGKEKVEEIVEEVVEKKLATNDNGCLLYGPDSLETLKSISLYRENFKRKDYKSAIVYWRYVFENAPGLRKTTYVDGEKMYRHFFDEATDEAVKTSYYDTLLTIYDKRIACYGEEGYVIGKKGLVLRKMYPEKKLEIYNTLQESIDISGVETNHQVLWPYFKLAIERLNNKEFSTEDITEVYDNVIRICEANMDDKSATKYQKVIDQTTPMYESVVDYAAISGINDCNSAKEVYGPKYQANPNDMGVIKKYFRAMLKYKCYNNASFLEIAKKLNDVEPTAGKSRVLANAYYESGDKASAKSMYEKAFSLEADSKKKSDIKMALARLEHSSGSFSNARAAALEAAALRPGWGDPYLFIGDLYAASGKSCGPGTGWDSQIVIWPAFDMYYKAKSVDPNTAAKAQKKISFYRQYLPEKKDGFLKQIKEGQSYSVGCWISRSTTARFR